MKKNLLVWGFLMLFMGSGLLGCNDDDDDKKYNLSINVKGNGHGTVISEKFDINCTADHVYEITENKIVSLTATAADGSIFVGWSTDCRGTGDCVVEMDDEKTVTATFAPKDQGVRLNTTAGYTSGIFDEGASEITAFDPATSRIFVVNGDSGKIDILDATIVEDTTGDAISEMERIGEIDLSPYGKGANSVAFKNGVLAAAVENEDKQADGQVVFFDADGNFLKSVSSGALPDMIKFSPDGNTVLVAADWSWFTTAETILKR